MSIKKSTPITQWRRSMSTNSNNFLEGFDTFGWTPNPNLSDDENFMDLTLLITRSSKLKQGSMACILAKNTQQEPLLQRIVAVTTNHGFYSTRKNSDLHAEMAALAQASKHGRRTDNTTAYITMPPCKNCFPAIVHAGVNRVVTRKTFVAPLITASKQHQVELVCLDSNAIAQRVNDLIVQFRKQQQQDDPVVEEATTKKRTADEIATEK